MAKEPTTKNETSKLNQAGQPVKPSIFAFPHSGDITHSKKKKIIFLVLAAVVLLLIAGLLYMQLTKPRTSEINVSQDEQILTEEEVKQQVINDLPKTEAESILTDLEAKLKEGTDSPTTETDWLVNASFAAAFLEKEVAKNYALRSLELLENFPPMQYELFSHNPETLKEALTLVSEGSYTEGLNLSGVSFGSEDLLKNE